MTAVESKPTDTPKKEGLGGLIAIMIAIVLGVIVGLGYGKQMWWAGGGPALEIERLEATLAQKEQLATEVEPEDPQEAERLRGHIPQIQQRLAEVEQEAQEHPPGRGLAYAVWEVSRFCGDLFIQALKLLVVPLVITSMVCGITSLGDVRQVGRVGFWTVFYYLSTGAIAVVLGIVLVQVIRPGLGADDTFAYVTENVRSTAGATPIETLLNVVRGRPGDPSSGMIPSNIFLAASETNVLALIVFALLFGGALTTIGKPGQLVIDVFHGANEAIMKMVHLVMWLAPVGIFGLATRSAGNWASSVGTSPR
jgi:Na+/H+-dicarboxylate symporter